MHRLIYYILPTILMLVGLRKYRASKWGIGFEVAKNLASRNAQVVLACRSIDKANAALIKIKQHLSNNPHLIPMTIDLGSLRSVSEFAEIIKSRFDKIDILINNAGVAYQKYERLKTYDGIEIHFGINHLGHFYLTCLLQELVIAAKGRIIVVTSSLHEKGKLNFNAIRNFDFPPGENLYADSKLANAYFAYELAKRLRNKRVVVYAVCPGWVYTGLFSHTFKWYHIIFAPIALLFMRTAMQGSQTVIYCATEPSLSDQTALLYRDCKPYGTRTIFFDKVGQDLWTVSQDMINHVVN
ncbi:hypothetical protein GWI33_018329 [Rhynchophorus ferrugineus]|uniref:Uncharacterized protein n=1 Tax=Rhynchophorus ferrugineus TaxID=354439 RepID=A0A834HWJ6_RHYFE|nr:hypothetical protein GWI33_018329 [Rhynchophorus ferrugineus]